MPGGLVDLTGLRTMSRGWAKEKYVDRRYPARRWRSDIGNGGRDVNQRRISQAYAEHVTLLPSLSPSCHAADTTCVHPSDTSALEIPRFDPSMHARTCASDAHEARGSNIWGDDIKAQLSREEWMGEF